MCGIGGIINRKKSVSTEKLFRITTFLQERGPEVTDIYKNDQVGLVHTRLKIIDLSPLANQPMTRDGCTIVFNGEIYNFQEIKANEEFLNYPFSSKSDTEVILAAYQIWGIEKLLQNINGMFAFAIYDVNEAKLILARDRFGKKPLYLYQSNDQVSFSSDIRSLSDRSQLTFDEDSLDYYLSELTVPQPKSIWKEIRQIEPGTFEIFSLKDWSFFSKSFWQITTSNSFNSMNEVIEESEKHLREAIKLRQVSDVPVGYFLSGGIDSGLIAALQASESTKPINTFSVGIEGLIEDELDDARKVANRYHTNHHEFKVSANVIKELRDLIAYVGEPFADSSILPTHLITKEIKSKVTVAISGDGGDELFGGYPQYLLAHNADRLIQSYPNSYLRGMRVVFDKVSSRLSGDENMGSYQQFFDSTASTKLSRGMGFDREEKAKLYNTTQNTHYAEHHLESIWRANKSKTTSDQLMRSSLKTRLLNDYLVKVDRASMFNSLEVRSPFLDYNLANFAFSIPSEFKFKNGVSKYILKKIASKYIRSDVMELPKKGFTIPISIWMRGEWKEHVLEHLENLISRQLFNSGYIRSMWENHVKGRVDYGNKLWTLYCLEVWFDTYHPKFKL